MLNLSNKNDSPKKNSISVNPYLEYSYEIIADLLEFILSIYELSHFSDDIYFDVNQKIISLFTRMCTASLNTSVEHPS